MARFAVVTDVHGDVHALADALVHVDALGIERVVCAGDIVDYGLFPEETITLLRARKIPCVRGNHDPWATEESSNVWDLGESLGEGVGPLVGLLTITAVFAALWSVRVQADSLALQRDALAKQDAAIAVQNALQREALAKQDAAIAQQQAALEREMVYRRHTALREVYGNFLAALDTYLAAVSEHQRQMIVNPIAEPTLREPIGRAFAEVIKTQRIAQIMDVSKERNEARWQLGVISQDVVPS